MAVNQEPGNLPLHANPCCGHMTDSSALLEGGQDLPTTKDIAICINCGAILVYIDPERNLLRYASRLEIEALPRKIKHQLSVAQKFIRKRGWISRVAKIRDSN